MNPIVKNILAVIIGVLLGSIVNMGIIMISGYIIPPPPGLDPTDMESLKVSMHLNQPKHYIFPFLAHALGTLAGAFATSLIAANRKMKLALLIGLFFLLGGIQMVVLLPSPLWFNILDLTLAYIPMGYLGWKLAEKRLIN